MTTQKPYKVVKIVKFGMLFGYGVKDIEANKIIMEYGEDDLWQAESKCALKNALKGFI